MALEHESDTALARAVRAAGSQSAFGRLIHKRQSVINGWLTRSDLLPAEFLETVEIATGVSRFDLRPDLAHLFARERQLPPRAPSRSALKAAQ